MFWCKKKQSDYRKQKMCMWHFSNPRVSRIFSAWPLIGTTRLRRVSRWNWIKPLKMLLTIGHGIRLGVSDFVVATGDNGNGRDPVWACEPVEHGRSQIAAGVKSNQEQLLVFREQFFQSNPVRFSKWHFTFGIPESFSNPVNNDEKKAVSKKWGKR